MLGRPRPTCGGDGGSGELPVGMWLMMGQQFTGFLWVDWTDSQALVVSLIPGSNCGPRHAIVVEAA